VEAKGQASNDAAGYLDFFKGKSPKATWERTAGEGGADGRQRQPTG
jgi:hypothetical protein